MARKRNSRVVGATAALGVIAIIATWVLFGRALVAPGRADPADDDTVETLLRGIQHNADQIQSLRGVFTVTREFNREDPLRNPDDPLADSARRHWLVFSDAKFREEVAPLDDAGKAGLPKIMAWDGDQGFYWDMAFNAAWLVDATEGTPVDSNIGEWLNLAYKYEDSKPLAELIGGHHPTLAGRETVAGVECFKLVAEGQGGGDRRLTWWVPPDSFWPLRVEVYRPVEDPKWTQVRYEHTFGKLQQFGESIWLPTESEASSVRVSGDGQETLWLMRRTIRAEELAVNEDIDPTIFTVQLPLSTRYLSEQPSLGAPDG